MIVTPQFTYNVLRRMFIGLLLINEPFEKFGFEGSCYFPEANTVAEMITRGHIIVHQVKIRSWQHISDFDWTLHWHWLPSAYGSWNKGNRFHTHSQSCFSSLLFSSRLKSLTAPQGQNWGQKWPWTFWHRAAHQTRSATHRTTP